MAQVTVYVPDRLAQAAREAGINVSAATQKRIREVLGIEPPTGPRLKVRPDALPAVVYRCYASDGTLLYVGATQELAKRFQQHRGATSWWPEVADLELELLASLGEAREAERHAILTEIPRYNIEAAPSPHRPHGKGRPRKERPDATESPAAAPVEQTSDRCTSPRDPAHRQHHFHGGSGLLMCGICKRPVK